MSLLRVKVDENNLFGRTLTDLERRHLPEAARRGALETGKAMREDWSRLAQRVFDRPTKFTISSPRYKLVGGTYAVDVFIRDEALNGTPPAKYLLAQVEGGTRRPKRVEQRMRYAGILPAGMFAVPGKGAQLDVYGNLPGSQINKVLSQLGARFDPLQNETDVSRQRRRRREAKKQQRRGDYFAVKQRRGRMLPGVYQRVTTGFGSTVRSILIFVNKVTYRPRYDIFGLAQRLYARQFPFHFNRELAKAVQTSRFRGRA